MTHTPGPWHVGIKQAEAIIYDARGWAIANATVYHGKSDREECRANATLIASAPALLAERDALRATVAELAAALRCMQVTALHVDDTAWADAIDRAGVVRPCDAARAALARVQP